MNTYIFPENIIEDPNFYGINYHNSLLPVHRGMNAEAWAIFDMDRETGITWHEISSAIDKGAVISQRSFVLTEQMTSIQLLKIQTELAFVAFCEFAGELIDGKPGSVPQDQSGCRIHRIKDIPNDGFLDLSWGKKQMMAFLRAMDYGGLNHLGIPKIQLDSRIYTWRRYKLVKHESGIESGVTMNEEGILISWPNEDQDLSLKKISIVEME